MGKLGQRLGDASRSGVYRASSAAAIVDAARESGVDLARIDASEDVLQRRGDALQFPDWFGGNWDALEDCLGDLSWRRHRAGHVLLFEGYPRGDDLGVLLDVLHATAQYWSERGRAFFAVFLDPGRSLALPDLYREA